MLIPPYFTDAKPHLYQQQANQFNTKHTHITHPQQ